MRQILLTIGKRILFIFLLMLLLIACTKKDNPVSSDDEKLSPDSKLIDTLINNVNIDVTIQVPAKMSITIPKGTVPAGTNLIVKELGTTDLPADKNMQFNVAYDVKLSSGSSFNKELTFTMYYDSQKLPTGKLKNKIGAAFFNESSNNWVAYNDVNIDSLKSTVTFKTDHLTKLSVWSIKSTVYGYTDYLESTHFIAYWKAGKIPSNASYNSPNKLQYSSTEPHYVKDALKYLEEAYSNYKTNELILPSGKKNVYITTLKADGETALLTGNISISDSIKSDINNGESQAKALKKACAHELLHVVQDYYYTTNFTYGAYRWWMEATATLADRIVWATESPYESEIFLSNNVFSIQKSWDDCGKDPDWYLAGGFLTYLNYYRPGSKISVINLIKECGSIKNGLTIRGIINSWLSNYYSTTIEKEYHNYLVWYFKNTKYFTYISKNSNEEFTNYVLLGSSTKNKDFLGQSIPYLAGKVIRAVNYNAPSEKLKINYESKSSTLHAYYYLNYLDQNGQLITTFERKLASKDSVEILLPNIATKWADILVVNESNSASGNYDAKVRLIAVPFITTISPSEGKAGTEVTLSGKGFGDTKGNSKLFLDATEISSVINWSNTSIKFTAPSAIGPYNVYVEVGGEKSNSVSFTVKSDQDLSAITTCKYIDIEIPFYATFEEKKNINGTVTNDVLKDEYQRINYDFQSSNGGNEIIFSGTSFKDSVSITDADGAKRNIKIVGSFASDYSSISSLTYNYELKKTTNDTNYTVTNIQIEVNNIPFSSKNGTSTAFYYGSYANVGKALIKTYNYTYRSLQSYTVGENQVYRKEVTSKVTSFKNSDTQYISVGFKKTQ